jgi:hypothetical protein
VKKTDFVDHLKGCKHIEGCEVDPIESNDKENMMLCFTVSKTGDLFPCPICEKFFKVLKGHFTKTSDKHRKTLKCLAILAPSPL